MKRFSLNTKRASKVLALALVASLVVPNVPGQAVEAASDDIPWADVPEAIGTESFDSWDGLTAVDTTGKAIKFTDQSETHTFLYVTGDGTLVGRYDVTGSGADVTGPGTDVTGPGTDVTGPGTDVTGPGTDVTGPGTDVTGPGTDVTGPGTDVTGPGTGTTGSGTGTTGSGTGTTGDTLSASISSAIRIAAFAGARIVGLVVVDDNGTAFTSTDPVPETVDDPSVTGKALYAPGKNFAYVDVDVTPELTVGKEGQALALKDAVSVPKYPSSAPNAANERQSAKTYQSKVEIENPFVAYRSELYKEADYTGEKLIETATKATYKESTETEDTAVFPTLYGNTGVDPNKGVTISFWAKVPYSGGITPTGFFEFENTNQVLVAPDDMAKKYLVDTYLEAKKAETVDEIGGLFYIGDAVEGTAVAVSDQAADDFVAVNGKAFNAADNNKFKYVADHGYYFVYNEGVANHAAAVDSGDYVNVYIIGSITTSAAAGDKEIVIDSGKKTAEEEPIYYHLVKSANIYKNIADNANTKNKTNITLGTEDGAYGDIRIEKGAVGRLVGASGGGGGQAWFNADMDNAAVAMNTSRSDYGTAQKYQSGNRVNFSDGKFGNGVVTSADEWHYYTFTISNTWLGVYIDGEAYNPSNWGDNNFNMASGAYNPDTGELKKVNKSPYTTIVRIGADTMRTSGFFFGYMFNKVVLDFITDPDTKLYIGANSGANGLNSVAGTVIDEMTFYKDRLTPAQVKYAYGLLSGKVETEVPEKLGTVDFTKDSDIVSTDASKGQSLKFVPDSGVTESFINVEADPTVYGDLNDTGAPDTDDASIILRYAVSGNTDLIPADKMKAADINKTGAPDTDDASLVLRYAVSGDTSLIPAPEEATFDSYDPVPEKNGDDYQYETVDASPNVVTDATYGKVVEITDAKSVVKYPVKAPNTASEIQHAKTYNSAAEITNPFNTKIEREKLYDASRYTFANLAKTATELTRQQDDSKTDFNAIFPDLLNRYSAPESKTGVTISFWAQTPGTHSPFLEFYNTESLVYQGDDMAKAYLAAKYDEAVAADVVNDPNGLFYAGDMTVGTAVDVGKDASDDFESLNGGEAFDAETNNQFKYHEYPGLYMAYNPEVTKSTAAIEQSEGVYKVYLVKKINTTKAAGDAEVVIDSGLTDPDSGETIYYHLEKSSPVYADINDNPNYANYKATDGYPYGEATKVGKGVTGHLYLSSNEANLVRDEGKTGVQSNDKASQFGENLNFQAGNAAYFQNKKLEADSNWHYYTYTLTDEWFQVFVDGQAWNPDGISVWVGNQFNLGSGVYKPNGTWASSGTAQTDAVKLGDAEYMLFGGDGARMKGAYMFGESVMSFITNENTKLYVGGVGVKAASGTKVGAITFHDTVLSFAQANTLYTEAREALNAD